MKPYIFVRRVEAGQIASFYLDQFLSAQFPGNHYQWIAVLDSGEEVPCAPSNAGPPLSVGDYCVVDLRSGLLTYFSKAVFEQTHTVVQ